MRREAVLATIVPIESRRRPSVPNAQSVSSDTPALPQAAAAVRRA